MRLPRSPSQTIGPYLSLGMPWADGPFVVPQGTPDSIWIRGRGTDGVGDPVPDGMVETWQAAADGRFDHPDDPRGPGDERGFRAFGRCLTDDGGGYAILTVKPGSVPAASGDGLQAPHIDVSVFARGMLHRVVTRIYFADETEANAADPVLATVPVERRGTLLAQPVDGGYQIDIHLQGEGETVFFAV